MWIALQHVPYEHPGLVATEARRRGLPFEIRHLYADDAVPNVRELDGLIVMGGPMRADDFRGCAPLAQERRLLAEAITTGRPVLGICLGAQLMARALGATVDRGPRPELGIGEVELTDAGLRDPVLGAGGRRLPVLHWHEDTFALPRGAERLAGSDAYVNQAFRVGRCAYGFQFHLELDACLASAIAPHLPQGVAIDTAAQARVERTGRKVIAAFYDHAVGAADVAGFPRPAS